MAIKYDENKGIGKEDYIKIIRFLESNVNADRKYKYFDYTAIIIDKKIKFYRYKQGKSVILNIFNNIMEIEQSNIINSKDTYILYEREKNRELSKYNKTICFKRHNTWCSTSLMVIKKWISKDFQSLVQLEYC